MASTPVFCDAHTHLDQYEQFDATELPGILQRSQQAGVGFIVLAGTTLDSTERCIALAEQHPMFYAGVGIHPMQAHDPVDDSLYANLESLARNNPRVVCISEVGLGLPAGFALITPFRTRYFASTFISQRVWTCR